jgi:hypothetical protein
MEQLWQSYVGGQLNWHQTILIIFLVWATQLITWGAKKGYEALVLPNIHDQTVMSRIRGVFKTNILDFFRTHDLSVAFSNKILDPLGEALYYNRFESPDFKFHDNKLEGLRVQLLASVKAFWKSYTEDVSCVENNVELLQVHKTNERFDPERKKYIATVEKINTLAADIITKFDALTAAANKKFDKKA